MTALVNFFAAVLAGLLLIGGLSVLLGSVLQTGRMRRDIGSRPQ